ncbi:hypothetical protein WM23_04605 [Burkholderia ubonensis]|nr:hypothetical protein WM23_04605 [Burkholderia ubonensis]
MMLIRRILAAMLGVATLVLMVLAALILVPAILALILRMTISTSISSSQPHQRAARLRTRSGSRRLKRK